MTIAETVSSPKSCVDQRSMKQVTLISCVGKKLDRSAPAKDLYASPWFAKARRYAEAMGGPWFILSAEFGLVQPDRVIPPYDRTLNRMSATDRKIWAARVSTRMTQVMPVAGRVVVLAGERYREYLMDYLRSHHAVVDVPMKGMRIGEQLQWLNKRCSP